jgi:deoxyribose-phosphate aldolase
VRHTRLLVTEHASIRPLMVPTAVAELKGSGVKVASVATAFPSGRSSLEVKLADTKIAVDGGADEIDMVVDRGAFLAGRYGSVFDQIVAVKKTCGSARLKVILETGELATYDNVRRAFMKTRGAERVSGVPCAPTARFL